MQLATRRVYAGRVVRLDVDTVRFPDGSTGELELIRHPGAAAVVPCLTDPKGSDPTILMIKQYRYAAGGSLWEVPAGTLDPNEAPDACARRELLEETGVTAERLEPPRGSPTRPFTCSWPVACAGARPRRSVTSSSKWCRGPSPKSLQEFVMARSVTPRRWWLSFIWRGFGWTCDAGVTLRCLLTWTIFTTWRLADAEGEGLAVLRLDGITLERVRFVP